MALSKKDKMLISELRVLMRVSIDDIAHRLNVSYATAEFIREAIYTLAVANYDEYLEI